jgi:tRNA U55 pseudouridine synthase TruB
VASAVTFEQLEADSLAQRDETLLPPEALAASLPSIRLAPEQAWALQNGQVPAVGEVLVDGGEYRVYDQGERFVGIAKACPDPAGGSRLTVVRMMAPPAGMAETN